MKTILSLLACLFALGASTSTAMAQAVGEYPLKKGDALKISITGVPSNDQQSMALQAFVISNEGTVNLTYLTGEVTAAGRTPSQLAREIESAYKRAGIYTKPTINVQKVETQQNQMVVTVGGNVKLPGLCPFRPGMKINEAIQERGGFDDFAKKNKVRLLRKGTTKEIDMRNISSHQELNVTLEPGDEIIVPGSSF